MQRKNNCSIRDLAEYVGLSTCTVSKVLNNRAGNKIPPATQQRVLEAARKLDYIPNINARRLFTRRSGVIALSVPPRLLTPGNIFSDVHFVDILGGMEPRLAENDYHLMLLFRHEGHEAGSFRQLFRAGTIDGLLIWGALPDCIGHLELEKEGFPYIFITSTPENAAPESVNLVSSDYAGTARQVAQAMLDAGCRSVLYLAGPEHSSVVAQLRSGVAAGLAGSGVEVVVRFSRYFQEDARQIAAEELKHRQFDAVLTVTHRMTLGALEAAEAAEASGVPAPKMFTLDTDSRDRRFPGEIAMGRPDDAAIGCTAIDSLIDLVEGRSGRIWKLLPGAVITE